jgi:FtsP/CotA-like multicopper oxidase with cupredoxin domain
MGGLIMGIHVAPNGKEIKQKDGWPQHKERKLSLIIGEKPHYMDTLNGKGFMLTENGKPVSNHYSIPGPPIILTKDQMTAITVVNKLKEPTTMHWHGLEIESYFDGVAGWGNMGNKLAPIIEPGDSFTVHLTPPRAGTYIYHTHMHNLQLLQGMSGPIIILNKGETFHPETDKIFFISQADEDFERRLFLLNGTDKTDTMYCTKGTDYRFRLINITALGPRLLVSLLTGDQPANWRRIAKDGADIPAIQQVTKPALNQPISIGETMDYNFKPDHPGTYRFEVRRFNGKLYLTKIIIVK